MCVRSGYNHQWSVFLQYTYLLTSQLESQRLFFEEKLAIVEKEANEQVHVHTDLLKTWYVVVTVSLYAVVGDGVAMSECRK